MHPYHQRRNSDARFAAITEYLGDARGFTCLELGALDGYFSKRLTAEYDAVCTAVDDNPLLEGARLHRVINARLAPADIRKLGEFDVALCLSVLHHLRDWRATLNALLASAPLLFIETAHPDEVLPKAGNHRASAKIHAALEEAGAVAIAQTPGYDQRFQRPLWVIDRTAPATADADHDDADDDPGVGPVA